MASRKAHPSRPLLANLYMRRFVLGWKKLGLSDVPRHAHRGTYADDLVILQVPEGQTPTRRCNDCAEVMGKLKLTQ